MTDWALVLKDYMAAAPPRPPAEPHPSKLHRAEMLLQCFSETEEVQNWLHRLVEFRMNYPDAAASA
jgi:hypothetical protein